MVDVWLTECSFSAHTTPTSSTTRTDGHYAAASRNGCEQARIGVDPHKRSHTAVAIDRDEVELAAIEVRASGRQIAELLGWAAPFGDRTWAVESAGGYGHLVAQQLVAAGERVLDVPATLAARVRVLGSGRSNKNDPNDGYSIAVAALHAPRLERVAPADHASVLRLLAKRNRELRRRRRAAWRRRCDQGETMVG